MSAATRPNFAASLQIQIRRITEPILWYSDNKNWDQKSADITERQNSESLKGGAGKKATRTRKTDQINHRLTTSISSNGHLELRAILPMAIII